MIEFVSGDFFDYDADIRINTVNCVGVMGAGVALMFKKKYPKMYKDYVLACKNKLVKPGVPHVWSYGDLLTEYTIINFPTKVHWRNPSKYEYIESGLIWLRSFLSNKKDSVVTLPALGCGHGGLEWSKVKLMINKFLGDLQIKILVFEPSSSLNKEELNYEVKFKNDGIYQIDSNDTNIPKRLIGNIEKTIYYKGNIELLNRDNIGAITNLKPTEREHDSLLRVINELPTNKFIFVLELTNSYKINLAKELLLNGWKAIFIIPFGLLQFKVRRDLESVWSYDNILLISTTEPSQAWRKYESINSFKMCLKLSDVTLINSLSYEYFNKVIEEFGKINNIFYINYWSEDIEFFENISATKIGVNRETKKPNIIPILSNYKNIN